MITLFSDIHLSDETTSGNVAKEAFHILQDEIVNNAEHKKAKEIKIVLLGDIFDFMRTDYWLRIPKDQRPWNGTLDTETGMNNNKKATEGHFNKLFEDIMMRESSQAFIQMLNSIPERVSVSSKVPVEVIYVVGNHDRAFNNYESLRARLTKEINNSEFKFSCYYYNPDYMFLGRHGHEYDKENYGFELYKYLTGKDVGIFDPCLNKVMSIGEVITCELMSGIVFRVREQYGMKDLSRLIMDVSNVRPMTNVFPWLTWYSKGMSNSQKCAIISSFKESLSEVINSGLGRKWDKIHRGPAHFFEDIIDQFEVLWDIAKDKNYDEIAKNVTWCKKYYEMVNLISKKILLKRDHYTDCANNEWENKNGFKDLQYVFYGHTHESLYDYFSGEPDGSVKMYINTGTYLPNIQDTKGKTETSKEKAGFARAYQMTMSYVCRKDEDGGQNDYPTLDLWNGIKRKIYKD